ncbi:MAG TPA: class I SAM-dependent methyltransferase [Polyangiaceae bacterium]|nr:class I SAM-dependent methyltransferase [Polyangiaceae bacterium]
MKLETEDDVNQLLNAAKALAVVSSWSAVGLFEQLRKGPLQQGELKAEPRAVATTLPVLCHLGLVALDGDRVALTSRAERLFDERALPTDRNLVVLRDLARLVDVLRDGGPVRDDQGKSKGTRGGTTPQDLAQTERFLDMLYRISDAPARSTYRWLHADLPERGYVLDLGGGHGRYARAFADAGHATTLFDQPEVVGLARKRHGDALSYLAGDFHEAESFGGPYDLVLLCNIVHGESPPANASIIARAARSLRPGGRIAVREMLLDDQRQNPPSGVFFNLTMLLYTDHGRVPAVAEVRAWFEAAGLSDFRLIVEETHQIAVARKV